MLEAIDGLRDEVRQMRESMTTPATPIFRTPEQVAPELGMTASELRNYCRTSGINTRLSKRRIMLNEDDVTRLVEWVGQRQTKTYGWRSEPENDPFA